MESSTWTLPVDIQTSSRPSAQASWLSKQDSPQRPRKGTSSSASPTLSPSREASASSSKHSPSPRAESPERPRLISHLPRAEAEAMRVFTPLTTNQHQYGTLGRSGQDEESMICECFYNEQRHERHIACGPGSDCINRLTQVECLQTECRSRQHCLNQRFTRMEYANVHVVQTERKGFGLRAGENIDRDAFIYEYIGEVVSQPSFQKRMRDYAEEGIRHFYFMMLQKEEYLDATKKGGIGRFANHSCNPNCYVAKWIVGKRMRMGIFAKRRIEEGEELTFNYNVDRYGHDAQPCYCDEPNCVGWIGGKTQTEVAGMDDLYLDALGIIDEVDALQAKGSKKNGRKSRKLGEDFKPVLRPMEESEVAKVISAMRQSTSNKPMLMRLLDRINMTDDEAVQRRIMRLRGFDVMKHVLDDFTWNEEIVNSTLTCMLKWQPSSKNKIEDAKIEDSVRQYVDHKKATEQMQALAAKVLEVWSTLQPTYRIPRRIAIPDAEDDALKSSSNAEISSSYSADMKPTLFASPAALSYDFGRASTFVMPVGNTISVDDVQRSSNIRRRTEAHPDNAVVPLTSSLAPALSDRDRLAAIILEAQNVAAAQAAAAAAQAEVTRLALANEKAARMMAAEKREKDQERKQRKEKKRRTEASGSAEGASDPSSTIWTPEMKDKKLMKLVGEVVVRTMSKHRAEMDHEKFKKYAKECTNLICEKEKKSATYKDSQNLTSLSEEKCFKIRAFTKGFVDKLQKRKAQSRVSVLSSSAVPYASSTSSINSSIDPSSPSAPSTPRENSDLMDFIGEDTPPSPEITSTEAGSASVAQMDWK